MRTRLAAAAVAVGAAAVLAPLSPASAQCGWTIEGVQQCGDCAEALRHVDAVTAGVREQAGVGALADQVACTQ